MAKPRILVSTDTNSDKFANYVKAISEVGGEVIPVKETDGLKHVRAIAATADGWLIVGGHDLPPAHEPKHAETQEISRERLAIENALYEIFDQTDKPILGICMGAQYLSWKCGGPLIQHLPDLGKVGHGADSANDEETKISIDSTSLLSRIIGTKASVRCHHHQAIAEAGAGYRPVAWDDAQDDKIIEAIEDEKGKWRIGVQWHPERTPTEQSAKLFQSFVEAANRHSVRVRQE